MVHSDAFRRMWSTTFRGAIECRNMFITEITIIDNTVQRNLPVYLQTLKNMTYSLNCSYVLLFTQFAYLFGLLSSIVLVYFQNKQSVSTGHTV